MTDIYVGLLDKQREVAMKCLESEAHRDTFTKCHNFLTDIQKLTEVVGSRPENVCLKSASHEFQYALSSVLTGQYRHAFASLRLTMELILSGIYFSGHEILLRQWENANADIIWGVLVDEDNGIFSATFMRAFHPFLGDIRKKYSSLAIATYRECSEFVHGNPQRTRPLEGQVIFQPSLLEQWGSAVENITLISGYIYLARYVASADYDARSNLEHIATDNLWHEEQVRACFEEE